MDQGVLASWLLASAVKEAAIVSCDPVGPRLLGWRFGSRTRVWFVFGILDLGRLVLGNLFDNVSFMVAMATTAVMMIRVAVI